VMSRLQVTVIPANKSKAEKLIRKRRLRVCAYARVSTEMEEQEHSYETQIRAYTEKITSNPEWEFAGIYADEGISGTGTKKRKDFLRMIEDCKKGKIDMILTKSISRFARNTVDCLQYVRMLRNIGVTVIFEKEGINTSELSNEMLLTIMGSFAQAESESISQNVTWAIRKNFKAGKVPMQYKNFMGFRKGADGKPEIEPKGAEVVNYMYTSIYEGMSIGGLKKSLEEKGIPSPSGKATWTTSTIRSILTNEKYMGDAVLQKTYTVDYLTKTVRKNNGELAKYYVSGALPAIVSKQLFYAVQEELARRNGRESNGASQKKAVNRGKYSSQYALTDLLFCGTCGTKYRRATWSRNGKKKVVWRCISRLEYGKKYCKDSPSIEESELHKAIINGINRLVDSKKEIQDNLRLGLITAISDEAEENEELIQNRIDMLNGEIKNLLKEIAVIDDEANDVKFREITEEVKKLQNKLQEKNNNKIVDQRQKDKTQEIINLIEDMNYEIKDFDEVLIRKIIEKVKIIDKENIEITFYGGIKIQESMGEGEKNELQVG